MELFFSRPGIDEIKAFAEYGNADAQYELGMAFRYGRLVEYDIYLSALWFMLAALQGHPRGMFRFGETYVPFNYPDAFIWFRKSAEAGCIDAQNMLGNLYRFGCGVIEDHQQALYWYQKAAEKEHSGACRALGDLYASGEHVAQSWEKSSYWYSKASDLYHDEILNPRELNNV